MKNTHFFTVLVFLIIASCSKEDSGVITDDPSAQERENVTFFTLNVNDYWLDDSFSQIIILNDNDGNIIDYKAIENNNQYVFQAKKEDVENTFSVTVFRYSKPINNITDNYLVRTYYNIKQGTEWFFNGIETITDPIELEQVNFNLKVTNIEGYIDHKLSSNIDSFNYFFVDKELDSFTLNLDASIDATLILTINFEEQPSKYIELSGFKNDDLIEITGDDLLNFDSYFNVNTPNDSNDYNVALSSYYSEGFYFNYYITVNENLKLGILNTFTNHTLSVNTSVDERLTYYYDLTTETPKDITITTPIDFDFNLTNNAIDAFEFESSETYNYVKSFWYNVKTPFDPDGFLIRTWHFYSDQSYNTKPKLPAELLENHPDFIVEDLEYRNTRFYTRSHSYESFYSNSENSSNTNTDVITETYSFNAERNISDKILPKHQKRMINMPLD